MKDYAGKTRPTTGRIDHGGNYCFENIILQSNSDNSKEVHERRPGIRRHHKTVSAYSISDWKFIKEFPSIVIAAEYFDVWPEEISRVLSGDRLHLKGVVFRVKS